MSTATVWINIGFVYDCCTTMSKYFSMSGIEFAGLAEKHSSQIIFVPETASQLIFLMMYYITKYADIENDNVF